MTAEALETAVGQYADMVFRVAYSCLGNRADAEDAMQETFYRLCREKKPFASEEHVKHWLIRVAVNESKKLRRSAWFRHTVPMEEAVPATAAGDWSELKALVMELPEKYRVPVYLYYYENWSVKEIAESLHQNPSTVQTWLMRARKDLRNSLLGGEKDDK